MKVMMILTDILMPFSNQKNHFMSHGPFDWLSTKEERNIFYERKQKVENEKKGGWVWWLQVCVWKR